MLDIKEIRENPDLFQNAADDSGVNGDSGGSKSFFMGFKLIGV